MKITHPARILASVLLASALALGVAPSAEARNKWSGKVSWDGATLKARLGLPYFSDIHGCGKWDSLATITKKPKWLENYTAFSAIGLGASVSVGGASASASGSSSYKSLSLRNTKGQKNSYLAGNVCMSWSTIYLGMTVSGTAMYNGQMRSASVSV